MQIKIQVHSDCELTLPLGHHHIQQAVVYSLMSSEMGGTPLHDTGYAYGKRQYKLFTFGPVTGEHTVQDKRITYTGDFGFELRTPDSEVIETIRANLREKGIRFGDHVYRDMEAEVDDREIAEERITVKMLSPVCVYATNPGTRHTNYFTPHQDLFCEAVVQNAMRKFTAAYGQTPEGELKFMPYKVGSRDKILTRYKSMIIEAYMGIYRLAGDPFLLTFLYNTGLGAKNSQGFGMFEVIG